MDHWRKMVRRDPEHVRRMFEDRWGMNGVPSFAAPRNDMLMTNGFWAMRSLIFTGLCAAHVEDGPAIRKRGFSGSSSSRDVAAVDDEFATKVDHSFGYTPTLRILPLMECFNRASDRSGRVGSEPYQKL